MAEKSRADRLREMINKARGHKVAHDLTEENPTLVKDWIPTGSRWLDSIIARGMYAGIPAGKIVEIAGLPSTGKSYLGMQIAKNAIEKDYDVVYFDSESAVDPEFLTRMGISLDDLVYVQADSVELVLETIEQLLKDPVPKIFIWDSLAMTACKSDQETDFNPGRSVGLKPRMLSKAFKKLTIPLANHGSTLLVLNQLYTFIPSGPHEASQAMVQPYVAPGGNALRHSYSLAIWLTSRKSKGSFIKDGDTDEVIGTEVKATIEKSRFGTYKRQCVFKILWGIGDVAIMDEESWFEAVKKSKRLKSSGAWYSLEDAKGNAIGGKFQPGSWIKRLEDPTFRAAAIEAMDEALLNPDIRATGPKAELEKSQNEEDE